MCFYTGSGELRAQSAPIAKGDKARMAGASRRDRGGTQAKSVGPQKCRYVCVSRAAIAPLSHRQSLIWIKGRNPFEGFLELTELCSFSRAAKMKAPLSGSLALGQRAFGTANVNKIPPKDDLRTPA